MHSSLCIYMYTHTRKLFLFIRMKSLYIHQRHDRIGLGITSFFGWSHHKTSKWFGWPYGFRSPGLVLLLLPKHLDTFASSGALPIANVDQMLWFCYKLKSFDAL